MIPQARRLRENRCESREEFWTKKRDKRKKVVYGKDLTSDEKMFHAIAEVCMFFGKTFLQRAFQQTMFFLRDPGEARWDIGGQRHLPDLMMMGVLNHVELQSQVKVRPRPGSMGQCWMSHP